MNYWSHLEKKIQIKASSDKKEIIIYLNDTLKREKKLKQHLHTIIQFKTSYSTNFPKHWCKILDKNKNDFWGNGSKQNCEFFITKHLYMEDYT